MTNVKIENLKVAYGDKPVFSDFSTEFESGKINVILGGSGVGKTTLVNAVAGIVNYDGKVFGADVKKSYIFQKDRLIPTISVYKNLDLILKSVCKDKAERRSRIEKMLDVLEILDVTDKRPTEISGGQAQRVSLARAYLFPSKILIMDEPFKALDTALKSRLVKNLIALNAESPRTILFVTHAIDECLLCADKFIVLGGKPANIILEGRIEKPAKDRSLSDDELSAVRKDLLVALENC